MNIKSEFKNPKVWLKELSPGAVIYATILGIMLGGISITAGHGLGFKIVFLIVCGVIAIINAYDGNELKETKDAKARRNGLVILFAVFVAEIGLFYTSFYNETIPVKIVVTDEVKIDKDCGCDGEEKEINYKKVFFYSLDTNKKIATRDIDEGNIDEAVKLFDDVTAVNYYISYVPFLIYSEEYKLIRK